MQKVDIGLKVLAGLAAAGGIIFAPFTSGASLTLTYASGAYLLRTMLTPRGQVNYDNRRSSFN
ncbi:hypothetical protein HGP05_04315 [Streptococcus sanguinis]|uniref:Uncharacterized protein n=1 Tax=Streptococcus sanguinis TaxID=1305 RepID=A0A7Y0YRK2_STRSA|nr:hypothetical protein [Streptococcus sanguinis]